MKILINTSNLYVGGGVQVALSFINELINLQEDNKYFIFLSPVIDKQIDKSRFENNFEFWLIPNSPSKLKTRKKVLEILNQLELDIDPDIVFTLFGPSYWKPKAKHLIGFADGWVYNPQSVVYKKLPFFKRLQMRLLSLYKQYYLKKDGDYFVLETEDAKKRFSKVLAIKSNKIFVVGNTYSSVYDDINSLDQKNKNYIYLPQKEDKEFRFVYIAHNHINKNIEILNEVIPLLNDLHVKFVLTLDQTSFDTMFTDEIKKKIINLGPIKHHSCPSVYEQCDALFAPTLLETFSAAYPEAMKMGKPILTSNYSFATDICQDAAIYFDPLNPEDIVKKIQTLIKNKTLQKELITKGKNRLEKFETASSRAKKYLDICEKIYILDNK